MRLKLFEVVLETLQAVAIIARGNVAASWRISQSVFSQWSFHARNIYFELRIVITYRK